MSSVSMAVDFAGIKLKNPINTASGKRTTHDSRAIRQTTLHYGVSFTTTISGARAIARAIQHQQNKALRVECIQDYYAGAIKGERA